VATRSTLLFRVKRGESAESRNHEATHDPVDRLRAKLEWIRQLENPARRSRLEDCSEEWAENRSFSSFPYHHRIISFLREIHRWDCPVLFSLKLMNPISVILFANHALNRYMTESMRRNECQVSFVDGWCRKDTILANFPLILCPLALYGNGGRCERDKGRGG